MDEGASGPWDVFISYASEDKNAVARPLAQRLDTAGLRVWFDADPDHIDVADRLSEKLNRGLAQSRFGVVILSADYLAKKWTLAELDAFLSRERREEGAEAVIPVLHGLGEEVLHERYPLVADRVRLSTADGLDHIVAAIVRVVFARGAGSPSQEFPTLRRRLLDLLEDGPDIATVRAFLAHHPAIVEHAFGVSGDPLVVWSPSLGNFTPDVCVGQLMATVGRRQWHMLVLGQVTRPLFDRVGEPVAELDRAVTGLTALRRWIDANLATARRDLPDITSEFWGTVVAGRRAMADNQKAHLGRFNDLLFGADVRTYDWLVDHA